VETAGDEFKSGDEENCELTDVHIFFVSRNTTTCGKVPREGLF
jgi:hypothetical protein